MSLLNIAKYQSKTLKVNDVSDAKEDLVAKIFSQELDLILLKNAIPQNTILDILSIMNDIPEELVFPTPFGQIYGKTLIGSEGEMHRYSKIGFELNDFILKKTKINLNSLCESLIFNLSNKLTPVKLTKLNGLSYAGYTIKKLKPKGGALHVHIGSEFLQLLPECENLSAIVKNNHQISFFYVLQTPEKGGELTLFDLDWKSSPPNLINNKNFYSHNEREEFFLSRKKHTITPEAGDLIVFNGGNIWHKINDIIGKKDRVTFGGFLGQSLDGKELLFWN